MILRVCALAARCTCGSETAEMSSDRRFSHVPIPGFKRPPPAENPACMAPLVAPKWHAVSPHPIFGKEAFVVFGLARYWLALIHALGYMNDDVRPQLQHRAP